MGEVEYPFQWEVWQYPFWWVVKKNRTRLGRKGYDGERRGVRRGSIAEVEKKYSHTAKKGHASDRLEESACQGRRAGCGDTTLAAKVEKVRCV